MRSFFGDCDRKGGNSNGDIVNTNPTWTKKKQISDMEEQIQDIAARESEGFLSGKAKAKAMSRKKILEKRVRQAKDSSPVGKIKGREADKLKAAIASFEGKIQDISPSHYEANQARLGTTNAINPQQQGRFSKSPCLKLENEDELEIAKACNMKVDGQNRVSRDDMTRGLSWMEIAMGIEPDHLRLRRDKPLGHTGKSSRVMVPELPGDMTKTKSKK